MMQKKKRRGDSFQSLPAPQLTPTFTLVPITLDEIVEEAARLPEDVLAELIERIVVHRHGGIDPGVASAWKVETSRRVAAITSGQVEGIPLEESLARAFRQLRR